MYGAHDCLTGYRPRVWWQWLLQPMSKTQSKSIERQIEAGVRVFDLRVRFDRNGGLVGCHGLSEYRVDVRGVVSLLESRGCYYRIVLENVLGGRKTAASDLDRLREMFCNASHPHCFRVCDKRSWSSGWNECCEAPFKRSVNCHGKKFCIIPWLWIKKYSKDKKKHAQNLPEDRETAYYYDYV